MLNLLMKEKCVMKLNMLMYILLHKKLVLIPINLNDIILNFQIIL